MTEDTIETHGIPAWYNEIFPAGPQDGFFHKFGEHAASFVDRGKHQLVISFDNLSDAGYPHTDVKPWAESFIRENGWSHLGIYARGPSWYRDARLIGFLEKLRDDGFFIGFERVTLIGTSMGGFAALTFAGLVPGAHVVALSPQSTLDRNLVPWEERFLKGQARDWTLPYSDAATALDQAGKVYVIYDPFMEADKAQVSRLPQEKLVHLKAFGFGHKSAVTLRRMEKLKPVMKAAITGSLTELDFYRMIRSRKDIFLYRKVMEAHLADRGHVSLVPQFQRAFKRRRRLAIQAASAASVSKEPAADGVKEKAETPASGRLASLAQASHSPRTRGNAWMVMQQGESLTYMSDQYEQACMGFEERNQQTLAQTPSVALAMLTYGEGRQVAQPLPEDGRFHVVDETLDGTAPLSGARALGLCDMLVSQNAGLARRTTIAISQDQAGITTDEALPGSALYQSTCSRLQQAVQALQPWGKTLIMDRVSLRLLSGTPDTPERDADKHYTDVARALRRDLTQITGQGSFPTFVVSQSAGSRFDGTSPVILSEGRLALDNPTLNFVVATPCYPFALIDEMPVTHDPEAQMLISEMETLAVSSIQDGKPWHCPQMIYASLQGDVITADFSTLSPLHLIDEAHGFTLDNCENDARITSVEVFEETVQLTLDKAPQGPDLRLNYAWGQLSSGEKNISANQGGLTDSWRENSLTLRHHTLRRYALSASVKLIESVH